MAAILKAQGLRAGLPTRQPAVVPVLRTSSSLTLRSSVSMPALPLHSRVSQKTVNLGRRSLNLTASAATPASPAPAKPAFKWGANMKDLAICVGIAVALWFVPPPAGVTAKAWHLLAVFIGKAGEFN